VLEPTATLPTVELSLSVAEQILAEMQAAAQEEEAQARAATQEGPQEVSPANVGPLGSPAPAENGQAGGIPQQFAGNPSDAAAGGTGVGDGQDVRNADTITADISEIFAELKQMDARSPEMASEEMLAQPVVPEQAQLPQTASQEDSGAAAQQWDLTASVPADQPEPTVEPTMESQPEPTVESHSEPAIELANSSVVDGADSVGPVEAYPDETGASDPASDIEQQSVVSDEPAPEADAEHGLASSGESARDSVGEPEPAPAPGVVVADDIAALPTGQYEVEEARQESPADRSPFSPEPAPTTRLNPLFEYQPTAKFPPVSESAAGTQNDGVASPSPAGQGLPTVESGLPLADQDAAEKFAPPRSESAADAAAMARDAVASAEPTQFGIAGEQADIADDGDHDGETVMGKAAQSLRQAIEPPAMVLAMLCQFGHPNPPHAPLCRVCGNPVVGQANWYPRPSLGMVLVSTGLQIPIDADIVVGRKPSATPEEGRPRAHLVTVPSPERQISRVHCEIRVDGWDVRLLDRNSNNGTYVLRPGENPVRVTSSAPYFVQPGDVIDIGEDVTLTMMGPQ